MEKRRRITLIASLVALLAVAVSVWLQTAPEPPTEVLLPEARPKPGAMPKMWPVPAFSFSDQNDKTVDNAAMAGRVWIIFLMETKCDQDCPRMAAEIARLQKQIPDPRVVFLSCSINPAEDSASARREYGQRFGIDAARWHFLCPPDREHALKFAFGMRVGARLGDRSHAVLHIDRFILVDTEGRVRSAYPLNDSAAMGRLAEDARALAAATAKK
jgi:protein SCO1/2